MSGPAARTEAWGLEVERQGETVIVTSRGTWPRLDWHEGQAWAGEVVRGVLGGPYARNVVVDLRLAGSFGFTVLGLLLALGKGARDRDGRLALCNASPDTIALLRVTSLDRVWPVLPTKEEALEVVQVEGPVAALPPPQPRLPPAPRPLAPFHHLRAVCRLATRSALWPFRRSGSTERQPPPSGRTPCATSR